jgi:hypothetical protein
MVEKEISQYSVNREQHSATTMQLTIEIGLHYMALIESSIDSRSITALELFTYEKVENNWYLIFQEVRLQSILFDLPYYSKQIFINGFQQTIIPESLYTPTAAQTALTLLYGWNDMEIITDFFPLPNTNVYMVTQIPQSLQQMLSGTFSDTLMHNSLSKQVELALQLSANSENYWLIQFYPGSCSIVTLQQQQLHSAIHFCYTCTEDVIYQIVAQLNTYTNQNIPLKVDINGIINDSDDLYVTIKKIIPEIHWQSVLPQQKFLIEKNYYPEHYLLPFFNITL